MAEIDAAVARHYTHGALERAIRDGLAALGKPVSETRTEDLAAIDEFHMGGRRATEELAARLDLGESVRLLDLGCGLGGAARFFAQRFGCQVTGVDLTPEFVQVAEALSRLVGLGDRVAFRVGSATALPFDDASFDRATLLHVGMNIADKGRLCAEARRVLRPDGLFGVYDVMRVGEGELKFPVPWASDPSISFLARPEDYRTALQSAGFAVQSQDDRRALALDMFRAMRERAAAGGPPPLGLHILMGREAPAKVASMIDGLERGVVAPVELIARVR